MGSNSSKKLAPHALNPAEKISFVLEDKKTLTHDTRLFHFALQTPKHVLGLPIGQHVTIHATVDDKPVLHSYTPITSDEVGRFTLLIKVGRA